MDELTRSQEAVLMECLRAIDNGASLQDCLARYPKHAAGMRPYLQLRSRLRSQPLPDPAPSSYQAGRRALLERVTATRSVAVTGPPGLGWRPLALLASWRRLPSALVYSAAALAVLVLVGGGALGASAAAGVKPAHDVLAALHIVDRQDEADATPGTGEEVVDTNDGADVAPQGDEPGDDPANVPPMGDGEGNGPLENDRHCAPPGLADQYPTAFATLTPCGREDEPGGEADRDEPERRPADGRPTKEREPKDERPTPQRGNSDNQGDEGGNPKTPDDDDGLPFGDDS